jgi:hypothetical protein
VKQELEVSSEAPYLPSAAVVVVATAVPMFIIYLPDIPSSGMGSKEDATAPAL